MRELLRDLVRDLREPLLEAGPGGLSRWQWIAGPALLLIALVLGVLLGRTTRAWLIRLAKRTDAEWDDKVAIRLVGPLSFFWMLAVLAVAHPVLYLSKGAERTFDQALRGGLYAAFFWALARTIGVASSAVATSAWGREHPISRSLMPIAGRVAKVLVLAMAVIALLSQLGVPVTSLLAGLGLGGLAFALAAQKTVENLIGAFSIGADRPFVEGDLVKIEEFLATVERIGLRSTRFRTADRTLITIPNGKLAEMRIESYAARDRYRLSTVVPLAFETKPAQVLAVIASIDRVLRAHPQIFGDDLSVRLRRLSVSSLDIDVDAVFRAATFDDFQDYRQEALLAILAALEEAGATLAYPAQRTYAAAPLEGASESAEPANRG